MSAFSMLVRVMLELARSAPVQGVFTEAARHILRQGTALLVRHLNSRTKPLRKTAISVR